MSKDIIKKPATGLSKWIAKETFGNFIYDQIGLLWRSAVMTAFIAACLRLFSGIPLDVLLIVALFGAALMVFVLDRVARRRGWLASATVGAPAEVRADSGPAEIAATTEASNTSISKPCPYELVHRIADQQAKVIRDFVSVSRVAVWEHKLKDAVPTIRWGFMIKNNSVFPISLVEVRNNLFFEDTELAERRFESTNEVQELPQWREGSVVFEQRLSGPEAQHIRSMPDGKFRFTSLVIKVGNANSFPVIEPQALEIGNDLVTTLGRVTYQETEGMASLRKERDYLQAQLREAARPDLAFEIDTKLSQVGTAGFSKDHTKIRADVRLRCLKISDSKKAVREFSAALFKIASDGDVAVLARQDALVIMEEPGMGLIQAESGWIVDEPITRYRWYKFIFDISDDLTQTIVNSPRDYFFRVNMDVVGQDLQYEDFFVESWSRAVTSNSYIMLRR